MFLTERMNDYLDHSFFFVRGKFVRVISNVYLLEVIHSAPGASRASAEAMVAAILQIETMKNWKHIKTILEGEKYEIKGINLWEQSWMNTGDTIDLKDPLYNQDYIFTVYRIKVGEITIEFAAGEFSNGVWGIYEKES